MSNAPTSSPKSGDSRRRSSKSRGGKSRSSGTNYNNRSQRSEEYRPQGPRPPRNAPVVNLSWWQKLLQAIGLYKAPVAKSTSTPAPSPRASSTAATKSNTRNARSGTHTDEPKEDRPKRSPRSDSRSRGGDPSTVESARVYVGNLSYDVTEHDLEELFKGVGGVRGVEIVYNRATHRSKGYGFVEMLHKDEAMRSVEVLHDQPFMGRKLIVSGAKARGADDREEQDDREEREERVVVAPVPAAAVAATTVTDEEPLIETVVETITEEPITEEQSEEEKPA
jgi:RNA recognition motif-containing protein